MKGRSRQSCNIAVVCGCVLVPSLKLRAFNDRTNLGPVGHPENEEFSQHYLRVKRVLMDVCDSTSRDRCDATEKKIRCEGLQSSYCGVSLSPFLIITLALSYHSS